MKKISLILLISIGLLATLIAGDCSVPDVQKQDCGYVGIDQSGCQAKGCCWVPGASGSSYPWCFYPSGSGSQCKFDISASSPGFDSASYQIMYNLFLKNLNAENSGAVCAAPLGSQSPGGTYYFHWQRDGALSMKAFMALNDYDLTKINDNMKKYVSWLELSLSKPDPNVDVRIEPKFFIPQGTPYDGGWCRPQNDGPSLVAQSLILYANALIKGGQSDYVKAHLWTGNGGLIKSELDWVVDNWGANTCDLWEEVRSSDFFWNRVSHRKALLLGATFADSQGDASSASRYRSAAANIQSQLGNHWTGSFIMEDSNRQVDGAVICAFNRGYVDDGFLKATDPKIASTVSSYNNVFCKEYPLNSKDDQAGVPGILYGRYPGDVYGGGNPWILTTAALAELLYRGANEVAQNGINDQEKAAWKDLLKITDSSATSATYIKAFISAGDSVLQRIYYHTKGSGFHMSEQLDKNTGFEFSAPDLTWSYANVLMALKTRPNSQSFAKLAEFKDFLAKME